MSPRARSKRHGRLVWRTWVRRHERMMRRSVRHEQEMRDFAQKCVAFLHAWALTQDQHVHELSSVQQDLYWHYRREIPHA